MREPVDGIAAIFSLKDGKWKPGGETGRETGGYNYVAGNKMRKLMPLSLPHNFLSSHCHFISFEPDYGGLKLPL